MIKLKEALNPKNPATRRTLLTGGAFILGFIIFAIIGIQTWEYSSSPTFCTDVCHDIHPEEPEAYRDSYHARVKCVECHMGRGGTIGSMFLKASHAKHLVQVIFHQYDRPLDSESLRPANESCEKCHWPPSFHGDTVREIKHYLPDSDSTEERLYLILKTGGGEHSRGLGYGIHWHIANDVEYITTDEHKLDIPWVRATLPDGRTVEYNDVTNPLLAEEIAAADVQAMDCVDCHNRIGHPFPSPDRAVDNALAQNRLSRELPFIKQEILTLVEASYTDQEEALTAVEAWGTQYAAAHPDESSSAIEQAADVAGELVTRLVFEEPGITWKSFPDNGGHKDFAGCFRCHDGEHLSAEGESIRLHCNICHSVPVRVGEGDRPPEVPIASIQEPASHADTNFMADHRFQANSVCTDCHGVISFGSDDSSFCANSACHGQAWPSVGLNAAFPHPIELEGKHTEVWCHDCHEGVRKPEYECANCHEPPSQPHAGEICQECHTSEGFELAASITARSSSIPHTLDDRDNCLGCHDPAGQYKPAPADHKDRSNEQCLLCHKAE